MESATPPSLSSNPPAASGLLPQRIEVLSIDPGAARLESELPWRDRPLGGRQLALDQVLYSIRLPSRPRQVLCARCGSRFRAAGPTGHANDRPICDPCLLDSEEELGMVLALVAVVRSYGALQAATAREHWEALEVVGAFAHIYERYAAETSGPARELRLDPSRLDRH